MAYLKFLIFVLFFVSNTAFAGYARIKPPGGWSQGHGAPMPSGEANLFKFIGSLDKVKGGTVLTNGSLNLGGQSINVGVGLRMAANASIVAAGFGFGNPLIIAGLAVGSAAYDWYMDNGFYVRNGVWGKDSQTQTCISSVCYQYHTLWENYLGLFPTPMAAAMAAIDAQIMVGDKANYYVTFLSIASDNASFVGLWHDRRDPSYYWESSYVIYAKVVPYQDPIFTPIGEPEFREKLDPKPIPDPMPKQLPWVDWPVEIPVINPNPAIDPLPAPSPAQSPRPFFVPTGDPVQNPRYNPDAEPSPANQPWIQPGVRVVPSPIADDPWRVDLRPYDIPQDTPVPKPIEELNPPEPLPNIRPSTDPLGLCDQYPGILACAPSDIIDYCKNNPDILACQKFDEPAESDLPESDVPVSVNPQDGWGGGGSCPSPRRLLGANVDFSFDLMCDFMSGIRPILLGVAWLSAAFILLGMKGGAD